MKIDSETIETKAGEYTITWFVDDSAEQPYDEGFSIYLTLRDRHVSVDRCDISRNVRDAIDDSSVSGAAIVRYLQLLGRLGVTLINTEFQAVDPSHSLERIYGVAWAPDDATNPDEYTRIMLAEWRAWAEGDTFGWVLNDSDGNEIASLWGYYGFSNQRADTLSEARAEAESDADARIAAWSKVDA